MDGCTLSELKEVPVKSAPMIEESDSEEELCRMKAFESGKNDIEVEIHQTKRVETPPPGPSRLQDHHGNDFEQTEVQKGYGKRLRKRPIKRKLSSWENMEENEKDSKKKTNLKQVHKRFGQGLEKVETEEKTKDQNFLYQSMSSLVGQELKSVSKKGKVAPLKISSKALETRQIVNENLILDEEEMHKEIDRLYEEQTQKKNEGGPSLTEEEEFVLKKENLPIEYFLKKKTLLELFKEFKEEKETKGFLDMIHQIVRTISYMTLTLKFNPLILSIVELIKMLFIRCEQLCSKTEVMEFLITLLRDIIYCQPSIVTLTELQSVLFLVVKLHKGALLLCHNPSVEMSVYLGCSYRFFRGVCLLQPLCFQLKDLEVWRGDDYWECVLRSLDWMYQLYIDCSAFLYEKWYIPTRSKYCKCPAYIHNTYFYLISRLGIQYSLKSQGTSSTRESQALVKGIEFLVRLVSLDPLLKQRTMEGKLVQPLITDFIKTIDSLVPVFLSLSTYQSKLLKQLLEEFPDKEDPNYKEKSSTQRSLTRDEIITLYQNIIFKSVDNEMNVFDTFLDKEMKTTLVTSEDDPIMFDT